MNRAELLELRNTCAGILAGIDLIFKKHKERARSEAMPLAIGWAGAKGLMGSCDKELKRRERKR